MARNCRWNEVQEFIRIGSPPCPRTDPPARTAPRARARSHERKTTIRIGEEAPRADEAPRSRWVARPEPVDCHELISPNRPDKAPRADEVRSIWCDTIRRWRTEPGRLPRSDPSVKDDPNRSEVDGYELVTANRTRKLRTE